MLDEIKISYNNFKIYIPLAFPITAISGQSVTGKSFVCNAMKSLQSEHKLNFIAYVIDDSNYDSYIIMPEYNKALVVIDNFDTLVMLHPDVVDMLNSGNYQALVFGRNFFDLKMDFYHTGSLVQEGNTIRFASLLETSGY